MTNCAVCSFYSCVCCHVHNVAVDNSFAVGDYTTLTTNCHDGGPLLYCPYVVNWVTLHVDSGRVILNLNEDLSETPGVLVKNSATQTGTELVSEVAFTVCGTNRYMRMTQIKWSSVK